MKHIIPVLAVLGTLGFSACGISVDFGGSTTPTGGPSAQLLASSVPEAAPSLNNDQPTMVVAPTSTAAPTAGVVAAAETTTPTLSASPVAETTLASGAQRYENTEYGFALVLPETWAVFDLDQAAQQESLDQLKRFRPDVADVVEQQFQQIINAGVIKFYAADTNVETGNQPGDVIVPADMNVLSIVVPADVTLDQFLAASLENINQLPNRASDVRQERVTLPVGETVRLNYQIDAPLPDGSSARIGIVQYALVQDGAAYALSFRSSDTQSSAYLPTFEQIARSFELVR